MNAFRQHATGPGLGAPLTPHSKRAIGGVTSTFITSAEARQFKLLEPQSETKIRPIEHFIAADAFRITRPIGNRTLSAIGFGFSGHFIDAVEINIPETVVKASSLLYTASDKALFDELGGMDKALVPFLGYIYRLMEMSEGGPSHVDGRSNFAYVRAPKDKKLWAIHWSVNFANEWVIGAVNVPHPQLDWRSGSLLFSVK